MPELSEIGTTVRRARLRLGVSQEEAARSVGVSRMQWSRWEHGRNAPGDEARPRVATFLRVGESALTCEQSERTDALTLLVRSVVEREVERALRRAKVAA